jgi:tripartite-type tricarboxylate transporter receptor subunit TctC
MLTRRKLIAGCAGGAVALVASPAGSQLVYPAKTITLVVPYPAGGTTDLLGRLVADQFKTGMGATVIVENKPGAGTIFGASQVAKAQPDGHTLLMATSTTLAINKTLYRKLPYDRSPISPR